MKIVANRKTIDKNQNEREWQTQRERNTEAKKCNRNLLEANYPKHKNKTKQNIYYNDHIGCAWVWVYNNNNNVNDYRPPAQYTVVWLQDDQLAELLLRRLHLFFGVYFCWRLFSFHFIEIIYIEIHFVYESRSCWHFRNGKHKKTEKKVFVFFAWNEIDPVVNQIQCARVRLKCADKIAKVKCDGANGSSSSINK